MPTIIWCGSLSLFVSILLNKCLLKTTDRQTGLPNIGSTNAEIIKTHSRLFHSIIICICCPKTHWRRGKRFKNFRKRRSVNKDWNRRRIKEDWIKFKYSAVLFQYKNLSKILFHCPTRVKLTNPKQYISKNDEEK